MGKKDAAKMKIGLKDIRKILESVSKNDSRQGFSRWLLTIILILFAAIFCIAAATGGRTRILLIGDSTMADKPLTGNPERGWGQLLPRFFDTDVTVRNFARNGRSTKSFIAEGLWEKVCTEMKPGDYLLIQFGHNDSKKEDTSRYAEPHSLYKENLRMFVRTAREKGVVPVLLTPVNRRKFDKKGVLVDTHGDFPAVVREVAAEENVPLIDVHKMSAAAFQNFGVDSSKDIFLWTKPGEYSARPDGTEDNTHFGIYGATIVARMVVDGMKELAVSSHRIHYQPASLPGTGKVVGLDYYFNCEWRKKKNSSSLERFHYIWEDTTFSGFSALGNLAFRMGCEIDSIQSAPTADLLSRVSMYIIVDPDTPAETERPNFITDESVEVISQWVKSGGVLVLLGNDKGNAEFEHLNRLASKFGIRFNEDSHHRVSGTQFEQGAVTSFPAHPLFAGVHKLYLKEVSSFSLTTPAQVVLAEADTVLMASAAVGKGFVFAVGDPWLYNEYYDNRKLPDGFDNFSAAENLFRWLLPKAATVRTCPVTKLIFPD
jgi:lysophospholipase L1-like esterase